MPAPSYAVPSAASMPVAASRVRAEPAWDETEMDWRSGGKKKHHWLGAVVAIAALGGVVVVGMRSNLFPGGSVFGSSVSGTSAFGNSMARGSSDATITASAKQPGVRLRLDGQPVGTLPLTLKNVSPGDHVLEFSIDHHYSTERQTVIVGQNEVRGVAPVSLKVIRGLATFRVRSEGATLTLVSGSERRVLSDPTRPVEIDTERPAAVEISKPGYMLVRQALTFEDAAEKTFDVDVGPADATHAPAAYKTPEALPNAAAPGHRSVVSRAEWHPRSEQPAAHEAPPKALIPKAEPPDAPEPAGGSCTVNINSIPASNVGLDGRPLGPTPKVGISVPAGRHTVVFGSTEGTLRRAFNCTAGSTKTIAVRLNHDSP